MAYRVRNVPEKDLQDAYGVISYAMVQAAQKAMAQGDFDTMVALMEKNREFAQVVVSVAGYLTNSQATTEVFDLPAVTAAEEPGDAVAVDVPGVE